MVGGGWFFLGVFMVCLLCLEIMFVKRLYFGF